MKKIDYGFILLFIATILLFSCRKNDSLPTTETNINTTTVTSTVKGVIVNELDVPVSGATVTLGSNTVTTTTNGKFEFRNKLMSQNNAYIKVVKSGYFNGNRSMMLTANETQTTRIKLLPKTITGTFNASSGGIITMASGFKITFPINAIVDANGTAFSGIVNVAATYLSPTATDLASIMIGDLRGIATNNDERVLETYGMVGVELTSTSGQSLKIATGKTAELNSPIPTSLQANAPATIPLWHFDEIKGRWIEEGSATKVGNTYVGNVSHFSFWNLDIGGSPIRLCVTVRSAAGQPLINTTVRISRASNGSTTYGYTDSTGKVCGLVFKNEPLILQVLNNCGNIIYTQNIGPYNVDAALTVTPTITIANAITITGTIVNCTNMPITNGFAIITTNGGYEYTVPVATNGTFTASVFNCLSTINYSIRAFDNATNQLSNTLLGSTSVNINVGNLLTCGLAGEFVNVTVDGTLYSWLNPANFLGMGQSSTYTPAPFAFASEFGAIESIDPNLNANGNLIFWEAKYNNAIGSYPLLDAEISLYANNNPLVGFAVSNTVLTPNPQINITAIGAIGTGFVEGNFNISMLCQPGSTIRNVQCNFKLRRN